MRKGKHAFHVRFRNAKIPVSTCQWSEWVGPVIALGPFAAAKAIVRSADWCDLPLDLIVEAEQGGVVREFLMTVSKLSTTIVTLHSPADAIHIRTLIKL